MNNVAKTAYIAHLMYFGITCVEALIVNFAEILWTLIVGAKIGGWNMNEIEKAIYTAKQAKTYMVTKYIENGLLDKAIVLEKHFDLAIQALQEKVERMEGNE